MITTSIFWFVDPEEDARRQALEKHAATGEQETPAGGKDGGSYRGPPGAQLCDKLCFVNVLSRASKGRQELENDAVERDDGRDDGSNDGTQDSRRPGAERN
eukprot:SAG22_NODE_4345_length_1296_cov_1.950710_2_plen_101_part_00